MAKERKTNNQFIVDAQNVHGSKFDYSLVEYKTGKDKVAIICRIPGHGVFYQQPSNHLMGNGCPTCSNNQRCSLEKFIDKARNRHGGKFDYSKVDYQGSYSLIEIGCPTHGWFSQKARDHLDSPHGCPKCYRVSVTKSQEDYISSASAVHEDKYDYSKTEYIGINYKIHIICPYHGSFYQSPHTHLNGHGCPECGNALRGGYGVAGFYGTYEISHIYLVEMLNENDIWLKVGLAKDLDARFKSIQSDIGDVCISPLSIWQGPAKVLYTQGEIPILFYSGIERLNNDLWDWGGRTECFDYQYKDDLLGIMVDTLSPLEDVHRIL